MEELSQLVAAHPDYASTFREVLEILPLLVRFPTIEFFREMKNDPSKSVAGYVSGSGWYVGENQELLRTLVAELPNMTRDQFLSKVMEDRVSRLPEDKKEEKRLYGTKQIKNPNDGHRTPWINGLAKSAPSPNRYSWSLRHLIPLCQDQEGESWQKPDPSSVDLVSPDTPSIPRVYGGQAFWQPNSLQYYYTYEDDEGEHRLPTTHISPTFDWIWHTSPDTIEELQSHLETLHKEIVDFDLDIGDPKSLGEFNEKVARGYWLISTLCETHRGTPHNAMMWLNAICEHHHLPPPIPKLDHFFLDTTMVVSPLEEVIEKWTSYFEPPLDQCVEKGSLAALLQGDGLLLKSCSPEVRSDEEWVRIAIAQNPSALQYASKELQ